MVITVRDEVDWDSPQADLAPIVAGPGTCVDVWACPVVRWASADSG